MGELQRAAQKYGAPWPNATAEENAAYSQQAQLGNMEFEQEVGMRAGPVVAPYVDADRAKYIGPKDYNVLGSYTDPEHVEKVEAGIMSDNTSLDRILRRAQELGLYEDYEVENDTTYAFGWGARPDVWGHEFDHRRIELNDLTPLLGEERAVLLRQAFYARDPIDWKEVLESWYAETKHRNEYKDYYDVENNLKRALENWKDSFLNQEAKVRKGEGDKPKKRKWAWDSLYTDAEDQYNKRKKVWSIDKYNQMVDRLKELEQEAQNGKPDIAE